MHNGQSQSESFFSPAHREAGKFWKMRSRSPMPSLCRYPQPLLSASKRYNQQLMWSCLLGISPHWIKRLFTICWIRKGSLIYSPTIPERYDIAKTKPLAAVRGSKQTRISSNSWAGLKQSGSTSALLRSRRWKSQIVYNSSKCLKNFSCCPDRIAAVHLRSGGTRVPYIPLSSLIGAFKVMGNGKHQFHGQQASLPPAYSLLLRADADNGCYE